MNWPLKYKIVLGFAAIYLIWGSTYLAIRFGVETMPPMLMTGLRFVTGGLILYFWMRSRGVERPHRRHWRSAIILGLLMPVGGTGLVTWAEQTVPSGLAALLVATVPMWVVLADWLRPRGTRPAMLVVVGMILGFAGMTLLIDPAHLAGQGDLDRVGAIVVVVASLSWAIGSVYSRHASQPQSRLMATATQMFSGGVALLLVSAVSGEMAAFDVASVSLRSWLSLIYLITIGSVAYAAYVWLLSVTSVNKVSTYAYVNPIVALFLGSILAGEVLTGWTLACSAMVIVAVVIIISARPRCPQIAPEVKIQETPQCVET